MYMRDKASPSWKWVKVVITKSGENFLLSCSDLKNLKQMIAAEAYSLLYSLGGYTYSNLVEEGVMEAVSTVEEGKEEADDDDFDGDDNAGSNSKVDEEELIKTKTPYEQKFIREFRSLFSETLNPKRFMKNPPMWIHLKQALSSKLDPSLYRLILRNKE